MTDQATYIVTWRQDGREHGEAGLTGAQAKRLTSDLLGAGDATEIGIERDTWQECINPGCTRPRSNATDECFECRYEPFGSEWQREQRDRY